MLAIIAGEGELPKLLLKAGPAHIVRFKGVLVDLDPPYDEGPFIEARFEQLGMLFDQLRELGVTELCLAGRMSRPVLDPVAFDPFTANKMSVLMQAMGKGDDALLRSVVRVIEAEGFAVLAAHELRPDLVVTEGVLAGKVVAASDAARARAVLDVLGPLDVGQGAVAARGQILGIETLQGTDVMLDFVAETAPGSGGVFVKRPKAGQDLRVDMPAIGPETIRKAAAAGLRGMEIASDSVLLIDRDAILVACEETGLNLWAKP